MAIKHVAAERPPITQPRESLGVGVALAGMCSSGETVVARVCDPFDMFFRAANRFSRP